MSNYAELKYWMAKNDVTQKELANVLEISQQALSRKLQGISDFKVKEIKAIIEYYKIENPENFFTLLVS